MLYRVLNTLLNTHLDLNSYLSIIFKKMVISTSTTSVKCFIVRIAFPMYYDSNDVLFLRKITFNKKQTIASGLYQYLKCYYLLVLLLFTSTDWASRQVVGSLTNQTRVYQQSGSLYCFQCQLYKLDFNNTLSENKNLILHDNSYRVSENKKLIQILKQRQECHRVFVFYQC